MPLGQRETNKLRGSAGSPRKTSRASPLPSCTAKAHLCIAVMLADFMGMQALLFSLIGAEPNKVHHPVFAKGCQTPSLLPPSRSICTQYNSGLRKWPLSLITCTQLQASPQPPPGPSLASAWDSITVSLPWMFSLWVSAHSQPQSKTGLTTAALLAQRRGTVSSPRVWPL